MKKIVTVICFLFFIKTSVLFSQNVGIGTKHPHTSAALEISDSSRGLLIPRLTVDQRKAIKNPATGLLVYQLGDSSGLWYFDRQWYHLNPRSSALAGFATGYWNLEGNAGLDSVTNFVGTLDSTNLNFRTNNIERIRIKPDGKIRLNELKNSSADSVLTTDSSGILSFINIAPGSMLVLDSIKNMEAYTGKGNIIFIRDTLRGGFFYRYAGSAPVDSGMVFSDTLDRKWARYVQDNKINIQWYGARPDGSVNSTDNNYNALMKTINYVTYANDGKIVFIPGSKKDFYYIAHTVSLQYSITIEGEGYPDAAGTGSITRLKFPSNTKGFFLGLQPGNFSNTYDISKLYVEQYSTTSLDSSAHCFDIRTQVRMKDMFINFASGNGINIQACANPGDPYLGNASRSFFENVNTFDCNNGFYIEGCDANIITFNNISAVHSRRWGIWDNGFLGNNYTSPHLAYNGLAGSGCVVSYGGKYYVSTSDDGNNVGNQPDISPAYWKEVGPMVATAWNSGKKYYSGGAYYVSNANAWTQFNSPYTEGFQPPAVLNSRSIAINGDQGAGLSGGGYLHMIFGQLYSNSDLILPANRIGIQQDNPQASLHVNSQASSQFNTIFETNYNNVALQFKNSVGSGVIAYRDNTLLSSAASEVIALARDTVITVTNTTGLLPGADTLFNLGTTTQRWRNVYAKNYFGNWRGDLMAPVYGGTGLSSYTAYALLAGGTTSTGNLQQVSGLGTTGQVLTSNGTGTLPSWQNVSSSGSNAWDKAGNTITAGVDFLGTLNNASLRIRTNDTARMIIDSLGHVGIGTSAPASYLHVLPAATVTDATSVFKVSANTGFGNIDLLNITGDGGYTMRTKSGTLVASYTYLSELYDFATTVRFLGEARVAGNLTAYNLRGYSWNSNLILMDNPYGPKYQATGDDGTDYTAHRFTVAGSMTGANSNLATFDNGVYPLFTIRKDGATSIGAASPHASAVLDASSTTKGFLPPRMTTTERNAVSSPAEGLIIYNLTTHKLNVYTGSAWEEVTSL